MDISPVEGHISAGFEPVRDAFAAVVDAESGGLDAQVAAYYRGELVVDLRAGSQSADDSLMGVYSVSKGLAHLVIGALVQEGVLDLEETVSHYWPAFGVHGKREILLRELMSHQAGLVGATSGLTMTELADDRAVAERLGAQRPYWRPASAAGYHALVMAALTGEVVYRATGSTVQSLFENRFRLPLDLDLYLGLPPELEHRFLPTQPMISTPEQEREIALSATDPDSLSGIAFNRHHPDSREVWELPNLEPIRSGGPASFGGIGTARSLAKLYSAIALPTDRSPALLSADTRAMFAQIQYAGWDLVLRQHKAWAVGFHPVAEIYPMLGEGAFGHSGAGGQQSLVDPRHELSYAFLRRRFVYPPQADVDHARILRALRAAADSRTR